MPKPVSGFELVKILSKKGFSVYARKGSHVKMICAARQAKTIIPQHKELSRGTLSSILRQTKLSEQEIREILG